MFRLIKIIFNSLILVLAIIGFNAIGGQKYVEIVKTKIVNYVHQKAENNAKAMGNFSNFTKFYLSLQMIAGRLELFPLLMLFSPKTWRRKRM